jgi:hypothetical protein
VLGTLGGVRGLLIVKRHAELKPQNRCADVGVCDMSFAAGSSLARPVSCWAPLEVCWG